MNRNLQTKVLSTTAILTLTVASAGFAATNSQAVTQSGAASTKQSATTTVAKKGPKISQSQATQIALKAHPDAKLVDIKLVGKVYLTHLSGAGKNYTLRVGANTGRIIKDKATIAKAATSAATTATKPAASAQPQTDATAEKSK